MLRFLSGRFTQVLLYSMTMMIEKSKIFEENILEITAISIICYTALHVLKQISDQAQWL